MIFNFIFSFFIAYSITVVPYFPICPPPPTPPLQPTVNPFSIVHVHGSFIHVLYQSHPLPSFISHPPSSSPKAINLFHVSMFLVLFFSLVYFVHQISVINEVIWYLSFAKCLISLNIIVSSSIHAVAKRQGILLSFCCIIFHCVKVPQFFNSFIC